MKKNITKIPSRQFVTRLEAARQVALTEPNDRAWQWIGVKCLSAGRCGRELRYPCGCGIGKEQWAAVRSLPMVSESTYTVVTLKYLRYRTRFAEQAFWIGQCSKCSKVYWGLARRRPRRLAFEYGGGGRMNQERNNV